MKQIDKVELAFRKFDTNRDGFLSRDEFDEVSFYDGFMAMQRGTF